MLRIRLTILTIAAALSSLPAWAQTSTGLIAGTISDPSGAVLQGVQITITHLQTNRRVSATSKVDGAYSSTPLPVGDYKVEAAANGFKLAVRSGITLEVNQTAVINIRLDVGALAERVEVVAEAPLLESTTSDLGKVVDNRRILELPLNTRNVYSLISLTPGAVGTTSIRYDGQAWSVYGARGNMNEIIVDGVSAVTPRPSGTSAAGVFPAVDAIQEFKLIGMNPPAEFGRTSGAVLNIVYKSGTNQWHGSAFEFLRNSVLDANDFFANSRGQSLSSFRRNQFGGVLSGPIRKSRTFFMVSYEGLRENKFASTVLSVPTELERAGDFSQTKAANGQLVQIFDPFSTRADGSGFIRTQFAGNKIPDAMINPVSRNVVKYFPLPNTPGVAFTNQSNYTKSGGNTTAINNFDVRVDHNFTDTQRFFFRYSQRKTDENPAEFFPTDIKVASGREITGDKPRNVVAEYSNTLSPSTVLTARLGVARTVFDLANQSLGFLPSSLGLPKTIDQQADVQVFPEMPIAGGYPTLGGSHADVRHSTLNTFPLVVTVSRMARNHLFKAGFDGRLIRANLRETRTPDGTYPFAPAQTQGSNPLKSSSTAGNSIASLLLGTGNGSELLYRGFKVQAAQSYYMAWYAQDDWKITPKLTLNLGVRYDFDTPKTERYNRLDYFDPNVASPLAGKVAGFPDLRGGLIHVGVDGYPRNNFAFTKNQFAPRLGFAWQANGKTVVRGGYGHVYAASYVSATVADVPFGFGSETPWVTSLDGITPLNLLSNPYPNGLRQPEGASRGLLAAVGQGFRAKEFDDPTTWSQQWNLTIQRSLPAGMFLETGYIGVRTRGTEYSYYANELDPKYISLGSKLNELVANPFYGIVSDGALSSPTVSRAQLLRPFPQFTDLTDAQNIPGDSWYHAFQVTVKKHMGYGLQFEGSYVRSKSIDRGEGNSQSHYRLASEKAISSRDIPNRLVVSYLYELPFGHGRYLGRSAPKVVNAVIGGWQFNGITTIQSGTGLSISATNSSGLLGAATYANNNGKSGAIDGRAQDRLNRWFDTSVFSQPDPFTFGNLAPRLSDIRTHSINNSDLSLFKEFRPAIEQLRVQFRAEALNAFNHVQFAAPNTSVTSSSFGRVTTQANTPRQVQFGLKLIW